MLDAVRAARALDAAAVEAVRDRRPLAGRPRRAVRRRAGADWVPELRLRGTVAFAPASHLAEQFPLALSRRRRAAGSARSSGSACAAIDTVDSALGVPSLLTPQAAALYPQTETLCYDALSADDSFGGLPLNQIFRSGANLAPLLAVIGESDPEHLRIRTPVRIEQGTADGTVFEAFTEQLVDEYAETA